MMRPTVNGANPFSTAIRHLAFCAFCQNSVTTYINDAAGTIIATVAITPPMIAPGTPPTVQPGAVADQRHDQDARARRGLGDREDVGELGVGHPVMTPHRLQVHFWQHRVAAADRQQRQRCEQTRQLQVGVASCGTFPRPRPDQAERRDDRAAPTEEATAARPFSTKAATNSRTGTSPVRHFRPVWMTIANVSATAAAEAPCRTPLTAGTSLNRK